MWTLSTSSARLYSHPRRLVIAVPRLSCLPAVLPGHAFHGAASPVSRREIHTRGKASVQTSSFSKRVVSSHLLYFDDVAAGAQWKGKKRSFASSSSAAPSTSGGAFSARKNRLRRSVHFVPGDSEKFLGKCLGLDADLLVLDLEDSALDKDRGRQMVSEFLSTSSCARGAGGAPARRQEIFVRINPLDSEHWKLDIEAGKLADGFMVPKVTCAGDLRKLDAFLAENYPHVDHLQGVQKAEPPAPEENENTDRGPLHLLLPIATETPEAVLNLKEIAKASDRVCAITWGCEDLSAVLGSSATRHPKTNEYLPVFQQARSLTLLAAKAANVQAIDGVYTNVRDKSGFAKEVEEAKLMGFDGKLSLHPEQIKGLAAGFSPSADEVIDAKAIVELFDKVENVAVAHAGDGAAPSSGAVVYKNQMVDLPHYVRAQKILDRAEKSGMDLQSVLEAAPAAAKAAQEKFPRVYMGKFFEELTPGLRVRHTLTRTVTEADNVFFTCLTLNPAPIHLDHELSKNTEFGKPLFNSMFTLALLVGMTVLETTHGTTIANLGFSKVVFPKPVFPGDTLRAETTVVDSRESGSRPTQGIVTLEHTMFNQEGDTVAVCVRQALMKKKPSTC